ncbi:hypothetical protein BC936DRAFT_140512 [Jimgerdemannia flammicorona]|uniref:Uncharacterized protein n=1 Tax=Jimgerdemannia flammicorona TaxID=994334 RepID=A0A433AS00_9FUNG|nr:hypothetical protein BC936DRAFT_140512 [Jimgerdemannia flammicorona]
MIADALRIDDNCRCIKNCASKTCHTLNSPSTHSPISSYLRCKPTMTNFIILLLFTVLSIFTFTASAELQDKPSPSQAAALDTTSATIDAPNTDIMSNIKLESNTDPLQAQPENMNSGYQPWAANDNGLHAVSTAQEIGASSDDLSVNSLQDFDLARIRSRRRGGRRGRLSRFRGSRGRFRGRWFRHGRHRFFGPWNLFPRRWRRFMFGGRMHFCAPYGFGWYCPDYQNYLPPVAMQIPGEFVMPVAGMIGAPMMQPGVMTGVVPGAGMMPEIMAPAGTHYNYQMFFPVKFKC